MSIDASGLTAKSESIPVTILPAANHPLILLSQRIPWDRLAELVMADLIATTAKGFIHAGRSLLLRVHLGVYLLQLMRNLTDRQTEWQVKDNAAYQVFCGLGVVRVFRVPDHTKIEAFRSRLSPATQCAIANLIAQTGVKLDFGDPSKMDQDSTVQEAGITYPADSRLLVKMSGLCKKVYDYFAKMVPAGTVENFNMKKIKAAAKAYVFARGISIEEKRKKFSDLFFTAFLECCKTLELSLAKRHVDAMPWNIRRAWEQVKIHGKKYFRDVESFVQSSAMMIGKAMSFHQTEVCCFNKKKEGKSLQFGRQYQLGRIGGNFFLVSPSTTIRMDDKSAVKPLIELHQSLFGLGTLTSFGTDKGFHSMANIQAVSGCPGIIETNIQRRGPAHPESEEASGAAIRMANRRSGIEPLIGHIKHGGQMGRSRMKTDRSTLASGYGAVAGFNLRQIIRHSIGKKIAAM